MDSDFKIGQLPEFPVIAAVCRCEMAVTKPNTNPTIVAPRGVEVMRIGLVMWWTLSLSIIVDLDGNRCRECSNSDSCVR